MTKSRKVTSKKANVSNKKRVSQPTPSKVSKKQGVATQLIESFSPTAGELSQPGKIAWYTLLAMVFLVPLAMSNLQVIGIWPPLNSDVYDTIKVTILRLGTIIAFIAWAYDLLRYGGRVRTSPLFWVGGAFLLWATISTLTSVSIPISFFGKYRRYEGLWSYFIYAILFFLSMQYVVDGKRLKQIAQALVFSSALIAVYGLLQAMHIEPIMIGTAGFEAGRSYSTYGNPDLLAGFLAFGVFVTFGLVLAEDLISMRIVYWLILLANSVLVITAYSRSIWVGFIVGIAAMLFLVARQRKPLVKTDGIFLGGLALATAGLAGSSLSNADAITNFGQRFLSIFDFKSGSALTRFEIWDAATRATYERPIFGFGPDTFRLIFRRYAPVEYSRDAGYRSVADNVHNYPLQLSAGLGVVGMLLYYAIAVWVAVKSFSLCYSRDYTVVPREERLVYIGLWSACAAYMVHLFFGLSLPGGSFLLFVFMGVLMARTAKTIEVSPSKLAIPAVVTLSIVGAFAAGLVISIFVADYSYSWALEHEQRNERLTAISSMEKAVKQNPYNDYYKSELFRIQSTYALDSLAAATKPDPSVEIKTPGEVDALIDESIELGEKAISFVPWEYDNYALFASFYNNLGYLTGDPTHFQKAIDIAEPQIKLTPTGLALRFVYAQSLLNLNRTDEAIAQLELCVKQDPAFTGAKELYDKVSSESSGTGG